MLVEVVCKHELFKVRVEVLVGLLAGWEQGGGWVVPELVGLEGP